MSVAVENLPVVFLVIVGIGMAVVLIGILRLANEQNHSLDYTNLNPNEHSNHLEELFSFFLQEEEKKNQDFRQMVMETTKANGVEEKHSIVQTKVEEHKLEQNRAEQFKVREQEIFNEIINRYEAGQNAETIAKDLKKGIGEVKLILSLYAMR